MSPHTNIRRLLLIVGIGGAVFAPPVVPLICIALLALRYDAWEALVIGLLVDFLWLPPHGLPLYTIAAIILVWALAPLRRQFLVSDIPTLRSGPRPLARRGSVKIILRK